MFRSRLTIRKLALERYEERLALATDVAFQLIPEAGSLTMEGESRILTVQPGATISFTARLANAPEPVTGFQLNFSSSALADGELNLRDWSNGQEWPQSLDGVLASPADVFVAAGRLGSVAVPPESTLGTFVVDVPFALGDYHLSLDSGNSGPFDTRVVGTVGALPTEDYGNIVIRVAPLWLSIRESPSATDDLGQSPSIPANVAWLHEWSSFSAEVWTTAANLQGIGLARAAVELNYNSDFFSVVEIAAGHAFQDGLTSSFDDSMGTVSLDGTVSIDESVGDDAFLLLGRIEFRSLPNDAGIRLDLGEKAMAQPVDGIWIDFNREASGQIVREDSAAVEARLGAMPETELWPVVFDLNDDGAVELGDLAIFAAAFLLPVEDSLSEFSAFSFKADFDQSGRVDFADFEGGPGSFKENFGKSRDFDSSIGLPARLLQGEAFSPAPPPLVEAHDVIATIVPELSLNSPVPSSTVQAAPPSLLFSSGHHYQRVSDERRFASIDSVILEWFDDANAASTANGARKLNSYFPLASEYAKKPEDRAEPSIDQGFAATLPATKARMPI